MFPRRDSNRMLGEMRSGAPVCVTAMIDIQDDLPAHGAGSRPSRAASWTLPGLSSPALVRLSLDGGRVAVEERIDMRRRIRDVVEAPNGAIPAIVDATNGDLLRLTPRDTGTVGR